MQLIISISGILIVMIGTILSLWSILCTKINDVGTAEKLDHRTDDFRSEKRNVIIGCIMIIIGSIMQIVGLLL